MAGRIRAEDVATVKERTSLEDVVREHVTLRSAGPGSQKGLCPFHDERTPSFTIRPALGVYHCFGCGEGGDVIEFVMKVDHLSFAEAVERLAARAGIELRYEEGQAPRREEGLGRRARLVEANRVAQEHYAELLVSSPQARPARDFLRAKGFDSAAAHRFGVGYAPQGFDALAGVLRERGFTAEEVVQAGLAGRGTRGLYDRFRGRVVWPIRDITGDTVGFGARRLFEDDRIEAKYLNTAETPVYKKAQVLYGLDLAKKDMARERTAVVVEGYTDVMACHLAGVTTAVATCGTSFGADHIRTLRRILRDEPGGPPARVVFTFDGDAAGQKAAMRAFEDDQQWASQSYVAVAEGGQDPCDLRVGSGDEAVRALVASAVPMFEFAVRTTLARFDLTHADGRVRAMQAVAPIVAGIRDRALQPEYVREVAGWIGVDVPALAGQVARAGRSAARPAPSVAVPSATDRTAAGERAAGDPAPPAREPDDTGPGALPSPDLRDPGVRLERELLQALLQFPALLPAQEVAALEPGMFLAPAHRAVFEAIGAAGQEGASPSHAARVEQVGAAVTPAARALVRELAVAPLPTRRDADGRPDPRYLADLALGVQERGLARQEQDALSALLRAEGDPERSRAASYALTELQRRRARLRARRT